jgi:hypothetical protein
LNLLVAAITLWNTVYLERAAELLARSSVFDPALLGHVSPLGWEHVNLTGCHAAFKSRNDRCLFSTNFRPFTAERLHLKPGILHSNPG